MVTLLLLDFQLVGAESLERRGGSDSSELTRDKASLTAPD